MSIIEEQDYLDTGNAVLYRQLFTYLLYKQPRNKIILRQATLIFTDNSSHICCRNSCRTHRRTWTSRSHRRTWTSRSHRRTWTSRSHRRTRTSRSHRRTRTSSTHRRTRTSRTHRRTRTSRTHRRTRIPWIHRRARTSRKCKGTRISRANKSNYRPTSPTTDQDIFSRWFYEPSYRRREN